MISVHFQGKLFNITVIQGLLRQPFCLFAFLFLGDGLDYCLLHNVMNVRSMNQGKLEVVKQEMARVNINILGIRELKWTAMGEFNSADHYIYYCGQESLRRKGVALIVNRSPKCSSWVQSQK